MINDFNDRRRQASKELDNLTTSRSVDTYCNAEDLTGHALSGLRHTFGAEMLDEKLASLERHRQEDLQTLDDLQRELWAMLEPETNKEETDRE